MQNTVIERNALNLSSNAYMNSTTKFVKGMNINPQVIENNKNPTIIASAKSVLQIQKVQSQLIFSNLVVSSSPQQSKQRKQQQKAEYKQQLRPPTTSPIELIAMNLSANIFMNSTTKFVKGFAGLAPMNNASQKQRKDGQIKKEVALTIKQKNHKNSVSAEQVIGNVEKIGLDMTAANYMSSTTKYLKQGAMVQNCQGATQKMIKSQRSISSKKLQQTLSRNRFITQHEIDKSVSKSDSESKIQRKRKDRTQDLKFIQPKYSNQSQSTIKDHPNIKQLHIIIQESNIKKEEKAEVQKQSNAKLPFNKHNQVNVKKTPASLTTIPTQKRLTNKNNIREIKSSDTKRLQRKQDTQRPFTRQPQHVRPHLLTTQKLQQKQKAQENPIQDIPQQGNKQKKIDRVKSQKIIKNEQLLLQTPIKTQLISKITHKQKQEQKQSMKTKPIPIITIKQQRSSMLHTKTLIHNTNKIVQQQTNKRQIKQESQGVIRSKQQIGNIQQSVKVSEIRHKHDSQLGKVRSEPTIKVQDNLQQTIAIASKKPIIRKNNIQNQNSKTRVKDDPTNQPEFLKGKLNIEKSQAQIPLKNQSQAQMHLPQNPIKKLNHKSPESINQKDRIVNQKKVNQNNYIEQMSLKASSPKTRYRELQRKIDQTKGMITQQPQITKIVNSSKETREQKKHVSKQLNNIQNRQQNEMNIPLKRKSSVVIFLLQKLYARTVQASLNSIKSVLFESIKHLQQATILYYQISSTYQHLHRIQLRTAFDTLKKQFLSTNISKRPINNTNSKEIATSLIFRSLISKQREFFEDIRWASKLFNQQPSLKQTENNIILFPKQHNSLVLMSAFNAIQSYQSQKLRKSFYQIYQYAIVLKNKKNQKPPIIQTLNIFKRPEKPLRNYQLQKQNLITQKGETQSSISLIEQNISNKKYYFDLQKLKLIKKQSELTQKNKIGERQTIEKRNKGKQLVGKIEQFGSPSDLDITLPQSQPLVSLLTEIYTWAFSSSSDKFNAQDLRERYSLNKQDQNTVLKEWEYLMANCKLKSKIAQWQRQNSSHHSYTKSKNEKETGENVLRCYIRQRYLWQCVKMTAYKL